MKRSYLILFTLAVLMVVLAESCHPGATGEENKKKQSINKDSLVQRGSYLVTTMVCDDCHSPKRMGPQGPEIIPELRLSGFSQTNKLPSVDTTEIKKGWVMFNEDLTSAVGPWGVSFSANITSDASGIGNWDLEQFTRAIREGKSKGLATGRPLLPPMPWPNFSKLNDDDLNAIFTFLKSTKPVRNIVPAPKLLSQLK
jgi:cytochrome c